METDFFAYSRQKIVKDKTAGRCDVANNRGAALKCLSNFLGKEELTFGELSPEMMTQFKGWLKSNDARNQPSVSICTRFIPYTKKRRKKPLPHICRC